MQSTDNKKNLAQSEQPHESALSDLWESYFKQRAEEPEKIACFKHYLLLAVRAEFSRSKCAFIELGIRNNQPVGALDIATHNAGIHRWHFGHPDYIMRVYRDKIVVMSADDPTREARVLWPMK